VWTFATTDLQRRDLVMRTIEAACHAISVKRQVSIQNELLNADAPATALPQSSKRFSILPEARTELPSPGQRAYHDSLFIARSRRSACFIPCTTDTVTVRRIRIPEDIVRGTLVLAETLAALSS